MPQYLLLLHDTGQWPDLSPEEIQRVIQRYVDWRKKVSANGRTVQGHKLRDGEGRLLRGKVGAPTITDGPYAEAKEVIGGLFVIDAGSYEEAVRLASDCPHPLLALGLLQPARIPARADGQGDPVRPGAVRDDSTLAGYVLFHATLGELSRETGDLRAAERRDRAALALPSSEPAKRFLQRKLGTIDPGRA